MGGVSAGRSAVDWLPGFTLARRSDRSVWYRRSSIRRGKGVSLVMQPAAELLVRGERRGNIAALRQRLH